LNYAKQIALCTLATLIGTSQTQASEIGMSVKLDRTSLIRGSTEDHFVIVEVTAPDNMDGPRAPADVALVVDTSGSMSGEKIANARTAARELVESLGVEDRVSVVRFSSGSVLAAPLTPTTRGESAFRAIDDLYASGGTNLYSGLKDGLDSLKTTPGRVQRVVLLSDGHPNSINGLVDMARGAIEDGTTVSTVGLGLDVNAKLLYDIGYAGGGSYHFVDKPGQLAALFADEVRRITSVAAKQVTVDVQLTPGVEVLDVYGYDAVIRGGGYSVPVGDLHAGQTKKLIMRVRIPTILPGTLDIADVRTRYAPTDGVGESELRRNVRVDITTDVSASKASVDEDTLLKGVSAEIAEARYRANKLWAEGQAASARDHFETARKAVAARVASSGTAALAALSSEVADERRTVEARAAGSHGARLGEMQALEALGYITH